MIDHISLKVRDFDRAVEFYTIALAPLGYQVLRDFPGVAGLGVNGKPDFWLIRSEQAVPIHVAFGADRDEVDQFHRAALAAGGQDHGAPGLRPEYHADYYAAFALDSEGNNVEAVCHAPPTAPRARKAAAKKAPARKAAAKKAPARKAAAKKAPARKAAAKKAAAKKAKR